MNIIAVRPVLERRGAVAAVTGCEPALVPEREQSVHVLVALSDDAPAAASISAVRSTTRNELLTAAAHHAVAAVTAGYVDNYFINHLILIDNSNNNKGVDSVDRCDVVYR
jgi:hypothetical protein